MTITLTVAGRIATVEADGHVVAGNTYPVTLALDSEWTGSLYLRVRFGSLYYDIPFASSAASVDVQMPVGYPEVGIGVFSEALEICTNEARVRLLRSILEAGEQVVEFDSDLYDQWAGEVSELLCDDAFDSTSDRPVKNSVITAWKDTVPLDANLVHKTGNESIAGQKTFTARMFVREPSIPSIHVVSETAYTATGWKGLIGFFDQKDGASNEAAGIYTSIASGEVNLGLRVYKPDRSGQFDTILRSYNDHQLIITTPYYPVDGSGNPQPIGANVLITSGNIAVDPRLVHTTGNETIAGNKALRGKLAVESSYPLVEMHCTSDVGTTGTKGAINFLEGGSSVGKSSLFAYQASNLRQMMLRHFRDGSGYADMGVVLTDTNLAWGEAPTYTADNSADTKIVTRSMLATTPTVVHTTGVEAIAGHKTFSEGVTGLCSVRTTDTATVGTAGQYKVVMKFEKAKLRGARAHTLMYFTTRARSTSLDLIALDTNNTVINGMAMNLRANNAGYTYILSQDETFGYISIICDGTTYDTIQAGVLLSTEPSVRIDAFSSDIPETSSDTLTGTEMMRLTP